jgi:hypothetical protein
MSFQAQHLILAFNNVSKLTKGLSLPAAFRSVLRETHVHGPNYTELERELSKCDGFAFVEFSDTFITTSTFKT